MSPTRAWPVTTTASGRVRKDGRVARAAFIVEALLLLVFLTGSLAVLMNLNAEADRIGRESAI